MTGTLVLIVGPSGAGKDTLLRMARKALVEEESILFPRRYITRPDDAHEDHIAITPEAFATMRDTGGFALSWEAHGLSYGLPQDMIHALEKCQHVVINASRAMIKEAQRCTPSVLVVHVTASPEILRQRLQARGRETPDDQESRLNRLALPLLSPQARLIELDNSGPPEIAATRLIETLRQLTSGEGLNTPSLKTLKGQSMDTILTNARIVTEQGILQGTVVFNDAQIVSVDETRSSLPSAIDCEGDLVIPGLIECHTDNMERHFMPRPKVFWPNPVAAVIAHDAQIAAAGITTVYDSICAGIYDHDKDFRNAIFRQMIDAVSAGVRDDLFRVCHRLHIRCELSDPKAYDLIEPEAGNPLLGFVSLMDHTPGRRQWRDIGHFKTFIRGEGLSDSEADLVIAKRKERGEDTITVTWPKVAALFRETGLPMASHDDTTEEHVEMAVQSGCTISEFPTTLEAARAAKAAHLKTVAGAPNVVRGGSHSGNVAVRDLAEAELLDVMSSDYVPSSLLQAVHALTVDPGLPLDKAVGTVTWNAADMLGLSDRGRIAKGKRADLVRLRFIGATPLVSRVWCNGRIAH